MVGEDAGCVVDSGTTELVAAADVVVWSVDRSVVRTVEAAGDVRPCDDAVVISVFVVTPGV